MKFSSLARTAGSAALAAGVIAVAAGPALAATGTNEAYGARVTGTLATLAKVADATPTNSPVSVANATLAGVLTTGVITDTAASTSASSTVANVVLGSTLLTTLGVSGLTATTVSSSCSIDGSGNATGSTTLADASVSTLLGGPTSLDASPTVDEGVSVPGLGVTVELNHQFTNSEGNFEVDALYITAAGETIKVGTSICAAPSTTPVPALPGMALPIGAGLLGLGGMGFLVSRRRSGSAA